MAQTNNVTTKPVYRALLVRRILTGAGIALFVISFFLFGTGKPNPAWGELWIVKPLIMVPIAGAVGGAFYHFIDHLIGYPGGWKKTAAVILGIMGYVIILWLGTVLGLNGTMWN